MTQTRSRIWVVDDDRSIRWVLEKALAKAGHEVQSFSRAGEVLQALDGGTRPEVLLTDIRMPGMDGLTLLEQVHQRDAGLPVIVITAHSDLDSAVSAYQGGAFEYLPKPFDVTEAVALVERAVRTSRAAGEGRGEVLPTPEIIGESAAMQEVFRAIGRLSRSHVSVLINGESGTGKELVARALHRHSPRSDKPFIALNTAAIPKELLESELFGHEKGAFTGAQTQRRGRFEQAHGGTLFLDEIGDMPAELQTRLLRVLAEGEFYRVGGHEPVRVDVRVIAATHQNLEERVRAGQFREDLFHRLNVIRLRLPPLRERREDIPLLMRHFLARAAEELKVEPKHLNAEAERFLQTLPWPGNVRQLENLSRWLTVMAAGREVGVQDLPAELREQTLPSEDGGAAVAGNWESALRQWAAGRLSQGEVGLLDQVVPEVERILIQLALNHTGGRRQEAARLLGWGRNTLTRKLKELGLETGSAA